MKLQVLGVSEYDGRQSYKVLYEGQEYYVGLYKFQETENIPNELDCNVKIMGDSKVSIMQNIIPFLEERYTVGGVYDFVVRNDFTRSGYYELVDKYGFYFRLNSLDNVTLYIGQEVTCRVIDMMGTSISLELMSYDDSGTLSNMASAVENDEFGPDYIEEYIRNGKFKDHELVWHLDQMASLVFTNEEPYEAVVNGWVLTEIKRLLTEYSYNEIITILKEMRDAVLYVLEETDCLKVCDVYQRKAIQNRLSIIGVAIKNYVKVVGYFDKEQAEDKVNRILSNLQASGYIFQATKQLGTMMRIFSLHKEMMEQKMMIFFQIIHGKEVSYWKSEPFRTAFIKLLELFISVKKTQVDLGTNSDETNVKQLLEALAIQMLLTNPKTDENLFDYNLNRATLYRYASYLKTSTPRHALQNAFLSLMDINQSTAEYSWADTAAHGLLASKLSSDISSGKLSTYSKVYKEGKLMLEINDDGMVIESLQGAKDKLKPALPANLLPWNHIQIRLNDTVGPVNVTKGNELNSYLHLWNNIERSLYSDEERKVTPKQKKGKPMEGETYGVRVLYKNAEGRLVCRIVDEDVEGDGYISPKDLVPYNLNMHPSLFRNPETGNSLLFEVTVINIDADEHCHFSAQRFINDMIKEQTNYLDRIPCLITGKIPGDSVNPDTLLGVSHMGFSVRFKNSGEFPNVVQGDIVFATEWEFAGNCCYKANILSTEGVSSHVFTVDQAFSKLMYRLSYDDFCEYDDNSSAEVLQQEDLLDRARVEELMSVVDRLAALESDYLVTYNYLGFAKMLAKLVNNEKRYDFYCGWMKLIAILHHFAMNGAVSTESLNEFEQSSIHLFSKQSEIHRRYLQLKIVSYKGKMEYNDELWNFTRQEDEVIRNLAKSVLAYNFLGNSATESTLHGIDECIQDLLNIKDCNLKLKDFGEEDLHNEFKTSIVYPSNNHMQPKLASQTEEILKEVCAMLNAEGGMLYIGVNNCGAGVGIQNDLKYAEFNGSKDKYDLYFHNNVRANLGKDEDSYLRTEFKEYMGRTIYEISITPCPRPVRLNGVIYERHGTSKVSMEGENEKLFIERRYQQFSSQKQDMANITTEAATAQPAVNEEINVAPLHSKKKRDEDTIQVSRLRQPAPFSYEECPNIIRYIQFVEGNYRLVSDYYTDEEDVYLTLDIREEDKDKYLILAYEDGKVCKIPMDNILDKEDHKVYSRYADKRLVFVEIAEDEDLLMSIAKHKRNGNCLRFDTVSNIVQRETLTAPGELVCTASLESYVQFDIIPKMKKISFRENTDLSAKQPGRVVKNAHDKYLKQLREMGFID